MTTLAPAKGPLINVAQPVLRKHGLLQRLVALEASIETSAPNEITLVIDSEGGDAEYAFECVEALERIAERGVKTTALIAEANSAAAIIALGCQRRIILDDGLVCIHLGSATIEGNEALFEGAAEDKISRLRACAQRQIRLLERVAPRASVVILAGASTSGKHRLNAAEAFQLGFVEEVRTRRA